MPRSRLLSTVRSARTAGLLPILLMALLGGSGLVLIADRAGLETAWFALGEPWEGAPVHHTVSVPAIESLEEVERALKTKVIFSVRWAGWWKVTREGEHRFSLDADDGGYLRVDGKLLVDTRGTFGEVIASGAATLDPGMHEVELGLYQTIGGSRLAVEWIPPGGGDSASLPASDLYPARPLAPRRLARGLLGSWAPAYRRLLGALLLTLAALLLRQRLTRPKPSAAIPHLRLPSFESRGARAALLLALFVATFLAVFPYTGSVRGGDDTAYLSAAKFNENRWFFNRYGHVYFIKSFIGLAGGDPFLGVRLWWSFAFATTVAALAVAIASVGPRLQLRSLAVTLFVLFSQTTIFGLIGAGFADYSAMMFVAVAVAVYLHGIAAAGDRPPPRHEWHALAIGALTVAAFRSKEVGAVVLLLLLFFALVDGRLDLRRFARRMGYWMAGAFGVWLTLVLLDGWFLGDFFLFDEGRMANTNQMNFPDQLAQRGEASWLRTIWKPGGAADLSLRNLWIGVGIAAVVAGFTRRKLEIRILHLLPIAYLGALVGLFVLMPHPFSGRMLITILPIGCLTVGLLLHHSGLDETPWSRLAAPSLALPAALAAAAVVFFVVPYRIGRLEAASFLPVDLLYRYGWEPEAFAVGVLLPAAVLLLAAWLSLVVARREARVVALLLAVVAFFGTGFEITRSSLEKQWAAQTGDLLLHPWRTFGPELNSIGAQKIVLSPDLQWRLKMVGTTRTALGRLALGRQDVEVGGGSRLTTTADAGIASRNAYQMWRRSVPPLARALAATAKFDSSGTLVLVQPKKAVALAAKLNKTLEQRLEELTRYRDPNAWDELLHDLLDPSAAGRLQRVDGDRLMAAGLRRDGWTLGTSPAALIVRSSAGTSEVLELRLAINAAPGDYPIRVFVDDGEETLTLAFDGPGVRSLQLRPQPADTPRLLVVESEKGWVPVGKDSRELGVRILGLGGA